MSKLQVATINAARALALVFFHFAARRVCLCYCLHRSNSVAAQMSAKSAARSHLVLCEAAFCLCTRLGVLHARLMDNGAGLQRVCSKNGAKVPAISLFSQSAQSLCAPEIHNGRIFSTQFN